MWKKIVNVLKHPEKIIAFCGAKGRFKFIPDRQYIDLYYKARFGKKIDFEKPYTFSQKLQWLKLNDRNPQYTTMVDKYSAKKYVESIIGKQYVIPTLGVWNKFDEINFDELPNQFVLKCTHDSGGIVICRDKKSFNIKKAKKKLEKSLKKNFYWTSREWPYKNVVPRLMAEKYMSNDSEISEKNNDSIIGLVDYKFYCFGGKPKFLYVSKGFENHKTVRMCFLDTNWKMTPFQRQDYEMFEELPIKPTEFASMKEIAKKLSEKIPFIRVDLYEIDGKVYFSEFTFFPGGGFTAFTPETYEEEIGSWIELQ